MFIIRQHMQPSFIIRSIQSQQAWIMSQQALSPLVQVTQQPSVVISHLHVAIGMLQQQTIMPFIMAQHDTMPPASMVHRFCIMLRAMASSQVQVTFMPPVHFSNFMVQRGIIMGFIEGVPEGMVMPGIPIIPGIMPAMPIPGMPIIVGAVLVVFML